MRLHLQQCAPHLGNNRRVVSGSRPQSLPPCTIALNPQGLHVEGWLANYRCFCNASVPLHPSPCGSESDGWYFHVASHEGQNAMVGPWLGGGGLLVLGGNLFHGFRGSSAVMNRLPLPVYKNIVCKELIYVKQTGQPLKQMWGRYSTVWGSQPPLLSMKILTWPKNFISFLM